MLAYLVPSLPFLSSTLLGFLLLLFPKTVKRLGKPVSALTLLFLTLSALLSIWLTLTSINEHLNLTTHLFSDLEILDHSFDIAFHLDSIFFYSLSVLTTLSLIFLFFAQRFLSGKKVYVPFVILAGLYFGLVYLMFGLADIYQLTIVYVALAIPTYFMNGILTDEFKLSNSISNLFKLDYLAVIFFPLATFKLATGSDTFFIVDILDQNNSILSNLNLISSHISIFIFLLLAIVPKIVQFPFLLLTPSKSSTSPDSLLAVFSLANFFVIIYLVLRFSALFNFYLIN